MRIAMVAPFEEAVPPLKYGGTELVVYNVVTELVARGHDVTLFATGDSRVPCTLVPIYPQSLRTLEPYHSDVKLRDVAKYRAIAKVIDLINKDHFDIVHNHNGWRFLLFPEFLRLPVVTTMHGPLNQPYQTLGYLADSRYRFVSISDNQRKDMPDLPYAATVYNGLDVSLFTPSYEPGSYLFFLGRMSPEKGVKQAIEVAKKTGEKLIIAAKIDTVDEGYWAEVKPMIDGVQIQFVGEIDFPTKVKYLSGAKALLAPIQWEEPFGLYVTEAMACGTPALGMARGSFPEIIESGKNGFLSTTVDEMAEQVRHIPEIDRRVCRKSVEEKFSKTAMADGYLAVYESMLKKDNA
jgi:glycosyltransferase involved in cell wall biosynthesis